MKTKKVRSSVDPEFLQSEEARIINSVLPPFNLTYEGLEYQEFSPLKGKKIGGLMIVLIKKTKGGKDENFQ